MNRFFACFCIITLISAGGTTLAQEKEPKPRVVTVRGTGVIQTEPDQIRLSMQVNVQGESASSAISIASERTKEILSLLRSHGVEEKDIQTSRVGVSPIYDREKRTQPPPIVGYSATNDFTALFRSKAIGRVGEFLDKATSAGASNFGGFQYETSRHKDLEREALVAAAQDARARADVLAAELGVAVSRVLSISETGLTPSPIIHREMMSQSESAAPVMTGEIDIRARVDVVFELKEKE